ncbi:MAG: Ada metal-binding domain-containing protein [Terriglobia bacterium]
MPTRRGDSMRTKVSTPRWIDSMATHSLFATEKARWEAVCRRDSSADGQFVFAVKSTGIYCRPSCPSRARTGRISHFS